MIANSRVYPLHLFEHELPAIRWIPVRNLERHASDCVGAKYAAMARLIPRIVPNVHGVVGGRPAAFSTRQPETAARLGTRERWVGSRSDPTAGALLAGRARARLRPGA